MPGFRRSENVSRAAMSLRNNRGRSQGHPLRNTGGADGEGAPGSVLGAPCHIPAPSIVTRLRKARSGSTWGEFVERSARFVLRHRWWVIGFWLLALFGGAAAAGQVPDRL